MGNDISVNPTPIQRNNNDVAIDLLNIWLKNSPHTMEEVTEDKIVELYKKFHKASVEAFQGK